MSINRKKKSEKATWYFYSIPLTKKTLLCALYNISLIIAVFIIYSKFIGEEPDSVGLVALFYLCLCAWCYHKRKIDYNENLHQKVAWISDKYIYYSDEIKPSHLRDSELDEYIKTEQSNLKIPQQHCIDFSNEFEKESLSQILNEHKDQVVKNYFCNRLKEGTDIYNLSSLEYYFFSLYCFVYEKPSYYDNKAYEKREKISDYTFKCRLTEYGRVYYKLKLITQSYIENNKQVQNLFNYIDKEYRNRLAEALDKNEVIFLR